MTPRAESSVALISVSASADDSILPIFVVGFPRSGTTLVQSLFAAHGRVLALPETHLLTAATAKLGPLRKLGIARRPQSRATPSDRRPSMLRFCSQRSLLREFVRRTDLEAQQADLDAWAEKTPAHLHFIPVIESVVPEARFVHVLRDPVPAIASLYRATQDFPQHWGGPRSVETCLRRWNDDVQLSAAHAGLPHHTMVRYEALVADPTPVAESLFSRVGIPLGGAELTAALARRADAGRTVVGEEEVWKQRTMAPIGANARLDPSTMLEESQVRHILAATDAGRAWLDRIAAG